MDWSAVERAFLTKSGRDAEYPGEKIKIVEVMNVYELGQLVAISFLEWVQKNPTGVIALPTGRTPEYFIKTLDRYRANWGKQDLVAELRALGFEPGPTFPQTSQLTFVMLDEFFPMPPDHRNAFCNYINSYYVTPMGIPPERVLTFDLVRQGVLTKPELEETFAARDVDLTLLSREPTNPVETKCEEVLGKVSKFCEDFEKRVAALGGIGLFVGGIGPDGHIAFNQEGSALNSPTRLVNFNYPTAAAAAGDLGGIEIARGKAAMTIGLATITANPNCKIIIMAAGEGKAEVVRAAIEDAVSPERPASVLHSHRGARFYLTHGSAGTLSARRAQALSKIGVNCVDWALSHLAGTDQTAGMNEAHMVIPPKEYISAEMLIYAVSRKAKIPVHLLTDATMLELVAEAKSRPSWLNDPLNFRVIVACAARRLREKIEGGLRAASPISKSILHTAPHHDDIMLSYHGAMHEMLGRQPIGTVLDHIVAREEQQVVVQRRASRDSSSASDQNSVAAAADVDPLSVFVPLRKTGRSGSFSSGSMLQGAHPTNTASRLGETFNGNVNHFAYLTSGFHSVNDSVLRNLAELVSVSVSVDQQTRRLGHADNWADGGRGGGSNSSTSNSTSKDAFGNTRDASKDSTRLLQIVNSGEMTRDYDDLMVEFRHAFLAGDEEHQMEIECTIFLRKVAEVWTIQTVQSYHILAAQLKERVDWLLQTLQTFRPGDAMPKELQLLKGCMRETEVDRVWCLSKMPMNRIHHMRSKFYTDDFFCPMPSLEDDALPFANLLRARQPEIMTVAFDPEGTGPDTHYKVLQVVAAGLKISLARGDLQTPDVCVWGYRNVWFVFQPSECTLMIPATENDLDLMHRTFMASFTTQKAASYPSPHYDGPFSLWAKHLQVLQKEALVDLLGQDYFDSHRDPRVRAAGGFIFLRAMSAEQFLSETEELKSKFEIV